MKLSIQNIAKVKSADIKIDGITVIGGYNSSGKSTISKALYSILSCTHNLDARIFEERKKSMKSIIKSWLEENIDLSENVFALDSLCDYTIKITDYILSQRQSLSHERFALFLNQTLSGETLKTADFSSLYANISNVLSTPEMRYINFIFDMNFKSIFNMQINTIDTGSEGNIAFEYGQIKNDFFIRDNHIFIDRFEKMKIPFPVYIESRSILDENSKLSNAAPRQSTLSSATASFLYEDPPEEDLTLEQYTSRNESIKKISRILKTVLPGSLTTKGGNSLVFTEHKYSTPIHISNMASGLKIFAMIQRLVENAVLTRTGFLIIDEPEVNLHPQWQVTLAEILVLLYREFHTLILINSHSPYFIRAVESFTAKYDMIEKTRFYFMNESENDMFVAKDVTDTTEEIYKTLYSPLENL